MTKDIRDAIIKKQDELIEHLSAEEIYNEFTWANTWEILKSELASLKAELEKDKEDYCTCDYQQPHTYGGQGKRLCVNCNEWINPAKDK